MEVLDPLCLFLLSLLLYENLLGSRVAHNSLVQFPEDRHLDHSNSASKTSQSIQQLLKRKASQAETSSLMHPKVAPASHEVGMSYSAGGRGAPITAQRSPRDTRGARLARGQAQPCVCEPHEPLVQGGD